MTTTALRGSSMNEKESDIMEPEQLVTVPINNEIQETEPLKLEPVTENDEVVASNDFDVTVEDCEMFYGVVMETSHGLIATRKDGVSHRELPENRRKQQGKVLHSICKKYNIKIPTEFEVIIFGGALIVDWQYMSVKGSEQETKPESTEEQPQEQEQKKDEVEKNDNSN